ncbi:hypothetical protein DAPPUDRAFT_110047 [Daphnia pulex]|uniref:CUB domain-containing protein n=1 Tax=Daphnia pulex TaxID=6669 RepID=E9H512_DAPPU|nr:hypothetical protein DAPPUDRAFT_110047 [Daphnia pulex]|eukprot:EFX73265.1 hypothetical protein DAPPUDRAFT_110047 [Daphnia pulex]
MKLFPIVFFFLLAVVCLAFAAAEAGRKELCNSQQTPTKLMARRTWPSQTAKPTIVTTTSTSTTTTAEPSTVSTTKPTTTTTWKTTTGWTTTGTPSTTSTTSSSTLSTTITTKATTRIPLPFLLSCSVNNDPAGTGIVQSPNFPGDYGNEDRYLDVIITAPEGWKIQLQFTTFNLNTDIVDEVTVDDGQSYVSPSTSGYTISTQTNRIVIQFSTSVSEKPGNAIYNWQATFSVKVFHLHRQFL